jgi:hypothetical protein
MSLEINIEKAKELHVNKWRAAREPLFEQLDALYFRISEEIKPLNPLGEDRAPKVILEAISRHKQELRDITKYDLSHIHSVEELEKIWPECLNMNHYNG